MKKLIWIAVVAYVLGIGSAFGAQYVITIRRDVNAIITALTARQAQQQKLPHVPPAE
jgi:hypothetical protein